MSSGALEKLFLFIYSKAADSKFFRLILFPVLSILTYNHSIFKTFADAAILTTLDIFFSFLIAIVIAGLL